ncbi:hypothetical protein EDEG_01937 [Edhazardia aedis USNM 41457]|uniref:V-type proton ATPase subunit C n=1 Tax=Edhazardia aedis (strain USNM 41457) TaxID=1003232 RepID=J9D7L2_EDHAE|nr:hypothetical protein EDEG_01937 [Edhazardia aedis USNM 41457]|eukprot:EJW03781.1 hypothetical protein EDEG_01937 [Edhazardia aedis USNM 41457]
MYVFAGLPIDGEKTEDEIKRNLHINNQEIIIKHMPHFTIKNFNSLVASIDDLKSVESSITDLFTEYVKNMKKYEMKEISSLSYIKITSMIKIFEWNIDRYKPSNIETAVDQIKKDITALNETIIKRTREMDMMAKSYENSKKITSGNLQEISILSEKHEFLHEHFLVVPKSKSIEFLKNIKECQAISSEVVDPILTDENFILYRILGLKSNKDQIKRIITRMGYLYREGVSKEELEKQKNDAEIHMQDYHSKYSNLAVFFDTNFEEIFSFFMHAKLLKLYADSIFTYGLGNMCFFAFENSCKESSIQILNKLRKQWNLSDRVNKNLDSVDSSAHIIVKNPNANEDDDDNDF